MEGSRDEFENHLKVQCVFLEERGNWTYACSGVCLESGERAGHGIDAL
jgi:hypothetical protein